MPLNAFKKSNNKVNKRKRHNVILKLNETERTEDESESAKKKKKQKRKK